VLVVDHCIAVQEKKVVVLDIRNDYEWDAGHFVGAGGGCIDSALFIRCKQGWTTADANEWVIPVQEAPSQPYVK
jgi:rhodanese-related sulfurtransferase